MSMAQLRADVAASPIGGASILPKSDIQYADLTREFPDHLIRVADHPSGSLFIEWERKGAYPDEPILEPDPLSFEPPVEYDPANDEDDEGGDIFAEDRPGFDL